MVCEGASVRAAKPQAAGGGFALLHSAPKCVFRGKTLGVLHRVVFVKRFGGVFCCVDVVQKW